jgi:hypothetical protein
MDKKKWRKAEQSHRIADPPVQNRAAIATNSDLLAPEEAERAAKCQPER